MALTRMSALYVSDAAILAAVHATGTTIGDQYFLGTAKHESGGNLYEYTAEPNGTVSLGVFQVNAGEAQAAGYSEDDLYDLGVNAAVFVFHAEAHRAAILAAAGLQSDPWTMGAWLAMAHNAGMGNANKYIAQFGILGWEDFRVQKIGGWFDRIGAYGDDCLYDPVTGVALVSHTGGEVLAAAGLGIAAAALIIGWGA